MGWKLYQENYKKDSKTQMQLLRKFCDVDCVVGCSRTWSECAKQKLELNNYDTAVFTEAVRLLLQMEGERGNTEIYL